ncbi:MAG: aromatic amino acid lyase, partial [Mangrovimonas sp.]|nr:aromatic amino acid lyase [Mangrovimonas sp.]
MLTIKGELGIQDFRKIILENELFKIDESILNRVEKSFSFLKQFSGNKVIYGVNTGFGPMAQYKIEDSQRIQLQYNLIRSHASGTGNPIEPVYVKAAMLARLNTLSLGNSGVHPSVVNLMNQLINKDIIPLIFEHGGVG